MREQVVIPLNQLLIKAKLPRDYENCLSKIMEALTQLDANMIAGRVVSASVKQEIYAELELLAKNAVRKLGTVNRTRAAKWITGLTPYERPRGMDVALLHREIPAPAPATPIALESVQSPLREQFQALVALCSAAPLIHWMGSAASAEEIDQKEEELGVLIPLDLKCLYRFCNGFSLFRHDNGESSFALVPVHELHTFQTMSGDDTKLKKIRANATPESLIEYPGRLRAFDRTNGDFLSSVTTPSFSIWVDDWREEPTGIVARSLAEVLAAALAQETDRWTPPPQWSA